MQKKWYAKSTKDGFLYILTLDSNKLELWCDKGSENTSSGKSLLTRKFLEDQEWQKRICSLYGNVALKMEIWEEVLNAQERHEKENPQLDRVSAEFRKDKPPFLLGHSYIKDFHSMSGTKYSGTYSEVSNDISVGITRHILVNSDNDLLEKYDIHNDHKWTMMDYNCYFEPSDCQNINKEYFEEVWNVARYPNV